MRVVDLSRVLAGPFCTMILGDMGADVVKVEAPGSGDDTRQWGPPFKNGESAYFLAVNRSKRSLTLDFKHPDGLALLRELIARADVLVENFRPGTLARLGLDDASLLALNPRLVYCAISGFGHAGPDRDRPGYDVVIQGEAGLMSLTGFPDGPPTKVGLPIADLVAALVAVQGILLGLLVARATGRGQKVDISMQDALAALLSFQAGIHFMTGRVPGRLGNRHPTIAPYETYRTADGHVIVAVGNDALWAKFCEAIGEPALRDDPRFATNPKRVEHREALNAVLDPLFATRPTAEWLARLQGAGVPAGAIKTVADVVRDPHLLAREMVVSLDHPSVGELKVMGIPIKLAATPGAIRRPPPLLGQHTDEVLAELGKSPAEIARLRAAGAV
ncbi:MAG TPA: CoA transferase [Thermodesulfobacteriota bacterium]|nr:CoA transferase [Thermodesulfobacteriota bacterium]